MCEVSDEERYTHTHIHTLSVPWVMRKGESEREQVASDADAVYTCCNNLAVTLVDQSFVYNWNGALGEWRVSVAGGNRGREREREEKCGRDPSLLESQQGRQENDLTTIHTEEMKKCKSWGWAGDRVKQFHQRQSERRRERERERENEFKTNPTQPRSVGTEMEDGERERENWREKEREKSTEEESKREMRTWRRELESGNRWLVASCRAWRAAWYFACFAASLSVSRENAFIEYSKGEKKRKAASFTHRKTETFTRYHSVTHAHTEMQ